MLLTAADLRHGRICEACHQPFRLGDPAFPTLTGVTADGTPVEGDWRCADCWGQDRPCRP